MFAWASKLWMLLRRVTRAVTVQPLPVAPTTTPVPYRLELPPTTAHLAPPLCTTPAPLILPRHTSTSPSGCLHHPVIPFMLCPPRCHCLGTGNVTSWGWETSPPEDVRCHHLGTGDVTTWGQEVSALGDKMRKGNTARGNSDTFLTIRVVFPRSGRSIAVLFHLLLETNGSRKIDKSEVTQLLLLDIFSSNQLGEEGVTKKVTFWPNRMFPQQIFILVD